MLGYLGQPERTAEALHDGWYVTGDIAAIDDEGFIRITDRLSRFSKIGGEMVPHLQIEEAIAGVLGDAPCAVTAVADEQRGERLVALYVQRDGRRPSCGSGCRRRICRACGFPSARICTRWKRCRCWARASWICARLKSARKN